ncbi:MAG TPA: YfbK domain-containing protein, partial [Myxococcales bacterium]|nr:YfbK domain-containing protein [Myxococcales bacterium]
MSADAMLEAVGKYVKEGVTLSTIGFGMGNYRDSLMERLADKGNGNCFYIDGPREAKRVFEERLAGTVEVIAKDVKIQVEFNPRAVRTYRLLGYENRDIADKDFRDDKVDAGEIGAGHTVTALYEVQLAPGASAQETLATVRIRAKEPFGSKAFEQAFPFGRDRMHEKVADASADFRFALAVAGTADILRHSRASEGWSLSQALNLAEGSVDGFADRKEFVSLLARAREMWTRAHPVAER